MRTLTDSETRAIEQLRTAFRGVKHGLWSGGQINAAPSRHDKIKSLQKKSEGAWSPEEIDWLYFKAATTVGDDETVKYVFVRYVETLLREELDGPTAAGIIVSKLDYAHFDTWPEAQRKAALVALEALSAHWTASDFYEKEALGDVNAFIERHRTAQ